MKLIPTKLSSRIRWLLMIYALAVSVIFMGAGWILLLEAEDVIHNTYLEKQLQQLATSQEPSDSVAYFTNADDITKTYGLTHPPTKSGIYEFFTDDNGKNAISPSTIIDRLKLWFVEEKEREFRLWYEASNQTWLIADLSHSEFTEAKLSTIQNTIICIAGGVLLLALITSALITRWALKPMLRLAGAIRSNALPKEKFADDEVGYLAKVVKEYDKTQRELLDREQKFISDCSHELRTPLTILNNSVELLRCFSHDRTSQERFISRIERSGKRMQRLTQTFLVLARNNRSRMEKEDVMIRELLEEVLAELILLYPEHKLEISIHASHDLALFCYRESLVVLCHNIIGNAFAHLNKGTLTIEAQENFIRFTDNGPGEKVSDKKSSGYGIGLRLVERLCTRENWNVVMNSNLGEGTQVSVEI